MHKIFITLSASFLLLLNTSCSSSKIQFQEPNFNLKNEEAAVEYEKFQLAFINNYNARFKSEGKFTNAKTKNITPLLEKVSPSAISMFPELKKREWITWFAAALWIGIAVVDDDGFSSPWYWLGAAGFFGSNFYFQNYAYKIRDQYNQDLKAKFSPSVGYKINF